MENWIKFRNKIIRWKYRWVLKPIFFHFDPENVHDWFISIGKFLGSISATRWLTKILFFYENPVLEQEILGIKFKNPLGLAAGFDKNGEMTKIMPSVGFGFTEIGSVTGQPCAGNERPRLWRLPKSRSLIVYYGLKNNGAEEVAKRLGSLLRSNFPVGVSLAKTNDQQTITTEEGVSDYLFAYQKFIEAGVGDYYTINISCPNTFGGEPFVEPERLTLLLSALARGLASGKAKPLFLKLPPDLSEEKLDEIIKIAQEYKVNGFICTNLTKDRTLPNFQAKIKDVLPTDKGGLSGKIVEELANMQIKYIYNKIKLLPETERPIIIGCGGIASAEDAYTKIKAGASLLQLITGMIFEGPQLISEINQGLVELLQKDGYKNISEAVGRGT